MNFFITNRKYTGKDSWNSSPFDAEKNDVQRTGYIVKQTYYVKNLHGENLKLFNKLHVNIFHENI